MMAEEEIKEDVSVPEESKSLMEVKGVGPKTAIKLIEAGVTDGPSLATQRYEEIAEILKITKKAAKDLINDAMHKFLDKSIKLGNFQTITDYYKNVVKRIPTGSSVFDKIMKGGIPTGAITIFKGEFASGKSELCYQLAVNLLKNYKRKFVWIATESGTFVPDRLVEIAKAVGVTVQSDDMIYVDSAYTTTPSGLHLAYQRVQKEVEEKNLDIGLWIVDSFSAPFRKHYGPREMLPDRCLAPKSKILMADFSYKRIDEIKIGDMIKGEKNRCLVDATVVNTFRNPVYNKVQIDSIIASGDHWFLTDNGYMKAKNISTSSPLYRVENNRIFSSRNISKETNAVHPIKENKLQRKACRIYKRFAKTSNPEMFCDIETTTGNYIAEGFVVHNSREENRHLGFLDQFAKKYNTAVVLTCQVMDIPDPGAQLGEMVKSGHKKKMVGGKVVEHGGTYLISLEQKAMQQWEGIIFDAPDIPRTAFRFKIVGAGIRDI